MWTTIGQDEIQRAKAELTHSHFDMDLRHAEECEALIRRHKQEREAAEAELTRIEEIERSIEAFVREYLPTNDTENRQPGDMSPALKEVEVVATWAKTNLGFRAA